MSEKDPKVVGGTSQARVPKWCAQEMKGQVCLSPQGLAAFGWSWKTSVPHNSSRICVPLRRPRRGSAPHQTSWAGWCLPFRVRLGRADLPPQMSSVLVLCLPAQVANLGRDSHLQLCSVCIPRAKENALQAIPLPAWAHTSALGTAFLDSSGPRTGAQPHLPSILPQGGARPPPQLCLPACPQAGSAEVLLHPFHQFPT